MAMRMALPRLRDASLTGLARGLPLALILAFPAYEGGMLLREARIQLPVATADVAAASASVSRAGTDLHALVLPTQKLEADWAATGLTAAQTLAQERNAFAAQERNYEALTGKGELVLADADAAVKGLGTATVDLDERMNELAPAIANMTKTTGEASALLADPALSAALRNFSAATANLSAGTKDAAGVASDAHRVTTYYANEITKPVALWKRVTGFAAWLAGRFY